VGLILDLNAAGDIIVTNILPGFGLSHLPCLLLSLCAYAQLKSSAFLFGCKSTFCIPLSPSLPLSLILPPIYPFFSTAASLATGAIKSGMIGLSDVLLQIDDTPVAAMSLEELNARTVGAEV
jgi:hypothetical protein